MKLARELLFPLIAVLAAFVVGGIMVLIVGDNPIETYALLLGSALSWPDGIGYTLFYATPLIFTGLAVLVAFRCGLLNIGAEGQLYVAAFATAWVGITLGSLPAWVLLPSCFLAAVLAGAVWGAIPGVLKARFGSHEVINTIMLNFVAVALVSYFTQYHYKMPGDPIMQTTMIGGGARIPRLGRFIPGFPGADPAQSRVRVRAGGLPAGVSVSVADEVGLRDSCDGQQSVGGGYGGISIRRQIVVAMAVSGALAGMVAINEVLGYRYRYYDGFSANYGFTGIAVALLGRNHPVGVLLAAVLFGMMIRGGIFVDAFTNNVTKDLVDVLQGIVILFVAAEALFRGPFAKSGWLKRTKV